MAGMGVIFVVAVIMQFEKVSKTAQAKHLQFNVNSSSHTQRVNDGTAIKLEFRPAKEYDWKDIHHGRYTVFDEERLSINSEHVEVPFFDLNNPGQVDPPWAYHGRWHPGKWHEIDSTKFMIPQVPDWKPENWGFSDMRFMPPYNKIAVEAARTDFLNLTRLIKMKPKGKYHGISPLLTNRDVELILKHARMRSKSTVKMTPRMAATVNEIYRKVTIWLTTKYRAYATAQMQTIEWAKQKHDFNITGYTDSQSNTFGSDRNARFMYSLALEHAQDLSDGVIPFQTADKPVRKPHWILNKDGKEWKEHLEKFGLDNDEKYCWWNEQSPLDIKTNIAEQSSFTDYDYGANLGRYYKFRMFLPSDGTTILTVQLENSRKSVARAVRLSQGALTGPDLYLERIQIKFGMRDGTYTSGSEHTIDGKGHAMELQFIFTFNGIDGFEPYYFLLARTLRGWSRFREKLVMIVSVFVKVVDNPANPRLFEPFSQAANNFKDQVEERRSIQYRGYISKDHLFSMKDYIPDSEYYVYRGSLTHPPCLPYVMWSVYKDPLEISRLQSFMNIPAKGFDDTDFVADNVRHIEEIHSALEDPSLHGHKAIAKNRYFRLHRLVSKSLHLKKSVIKDSNFDYYDDSLAPGITNSFMLCSLLICLLLLL